MTLQVRAATAVFLCCMMPVASAMASVDFGEAAIARYGKAQREFLDAVLAVKPPNVSQPAKSVAASHALANSIEDRPPVNLAPLAKDPALGGEAWLLYAESLYAAEQYESAGLALQKIEEPFRQSQGNRIESLSIRLALRGVGKLPAVQGRPDQDPVMVFNRILVLARSGDLTQAIAQLGALAGNPATLAEIRQRAQLWLMLLLEQSGKKAEAQAALSRIDGASPYLQEALLAYLRMDADLHPATIGAVDKVLAGLPQNSLAVWEVRERLIQSLRAKGAFSQASGLIGETINAIGEGLKKNDEDIARRERMTESERIAALVQLSAERRYRVEMLVRRKESLQKAISLLNAWRPHMNSYQEKIQRNRVKFADEIKQAILESSQQADGSTSQSALFQLELSKLLGKPADPNIAYRLFVGLSQWEFDYEYPETWRPPVDQAAQKDRSRTDRRRVKEAQQRRERDDKKLLPKALDHSKKMLGKINKSLSSVQRFAFDGLDLAAKSLAERSQTKVSELEAMLPLIEDGIRNEWVQDVRDSRRVAQQWLLRFAFHAQAEISRASAASGQPYYELGRVPVLKAGEPLVRAMGGVAPSAPVEGHKSGASDLLPVLDLLKSVIVGGETRQIRADALRLRAQWVIALNEAQAIPSATDAVDHYALLLREYSDLIDPVDVTYQLARAQDLSQRLEDSLATLQALVRKYPNDLRANEVTFRIGESQFSLSEYLLARKAYEAVIARGESRYRDQAEYKLAWTLFRQGDYRGSLPRFVGVIERAYSDVGGDDLTRRNRVQDALRATGLTFSYLNGPEEVERYFTGKETAPYVPAIYYSLTRYYLDHSRVNDAAIAYGYLIKHYPFDARGPELLAATIHAARKEKLGRLALDLQAQFVDRYSINGPQWGQASPELRLQIATHMKPLLADSARMHHAYAQEHKSRDAYANAIRYYQQYVATFPDDIMTPQFHFLLAEARFETDDIERAMVDYEKVAFGYGSHDKAAEAGYALLIATQRLAERERDPAEKKALLGLLVTRSSRFASVFPGDARVESVLAKAGEDMLMIGEASEAVRLGVVLLSRNPSAQVSRRASLIAAHGYFESGAFDKAEAAYVQVLALKGFSDKEQKELNERLGLSIYRQAEALRSAGDAPRAIAAFLRVGQVAPDTEVVPNAEIDASALLLSSKRWAEAIDILERFAKKYSGHALNADIPVRLAFAYENDGRLVKAADLLETLSQSEKEDVLARQMLWRSAELREKAERTDLALLTFQRYLIRYPLPLEKATEVRQSLADLAGKAKDVATRDRWLTEIIEQTKLAGGQETVRVRFLAAMASVTLGDGKADEFEAVRLKLPLDKSLADKRRAMEAALRWYDEAGRYGVAEVTTAATFKTAELYRGLAREVIASERPSGLSALEKDQYNILLEEEASPIEEKATELHEVNYQRIGSGTYDDWVKKSMASLRSLLPSRYDRVETIVPHFDYTPPKPVATAAPAPARSEVVKPGEANAPTVR